MNNSTEIYDFLSAVISAIPYGIIAVDLRGEVMLFNQRGLDFLEIEQRAKDIIEKELPVFLDHLPDLQDILLQCIQMGREDFELTIHSPQKQYLSIHGRQIINGMILAVENVTMQKEVQIATLNAMFAGEEKERRRWAREIHDGIGPILSAIAMNLDQVKEDVMSNPNSRNQDFLKKAQSLLKSVTRDLRSISHDLMPSVLEDFGLPTAIEHLCTQAHPPGGVPEVQSILSGHFQRLHPGIELSLFRTAQELLQNALKYAQAKRITLQLIKSQGSIILMVEDDGIGFNKNEISARAGIGLKNIATRIGAIGGTFALDTKKNNGTVATIEIPYSETL